MFGDSLNYFRNKLKTKQKKSIYNKGFNIFLLSKHFILS